MKNLPVLFAAFIIVITLPARAQSLSNSVTCQLDSFYVQDFNQSSPNAWTTSQICYDSYDLNGNLMVQISKTASGAQSWVNMWKDTRSYNSQNIITTSIMQGWDLNTNTWQNYERISYSYTTNMQLTYKTTERWNNSSNSWYFTRKTTNIYDANSDLIEEVTYQFNPATLNWDLFFRFVNTYDQYHHKINILSQQYDQSSNLWINSYRESLTYSSNYQVSGLTELWSLNSSSWDAYLKDTSVYNSNFSNLSKTYQLWNATGWNNSNRTSNTFDVNNNKIIQREQEWSNNSNSWQDKYKYLFYYTCNSVSATGLTKNKISVPISIFPNPSSSQVFLKTDLNFKSISLVNLFGQQVLKIEKTDVFSISELQPGIYFIHLSGENGSLMYQEKIIKE